MMADLTYHILPTHTQERTDKTHVIGDAVCFPDDFREGGNVRTFRNGLLFTVRQHTRAELGMYPSPIWVQYGKSASLHEKMGATACAPILFIFNRVSRVSYLFDVERSVTSWYPPSTIDVADTSVRRAFFCRSGMFVTPTLHMVDFTL